MRLRNDTGGVLSAPDLGRDFGPGEEFDHDTAGLGVVPGCVPVVPEDAGPGSPGDEQDPPAKPSRAKTAVKAREADG